MLNNEVALEYYRLQKVGTTEIMPEKDKPGELDPTSEAGLRKAKELLFTGGRLSASEAKEIGLVNKVVPRDQLDIAALELAQRVAQAPPFAISLLKRSLNRSMDVQGMREALSAHFDLHQLSHLSEEYQATRKAGLASAISKTRSET